MVAALGDRWSYYIPAQEYAAYEQQKKNAYVGIGVTITTTENGYPIQKVAEGGPADLILIDQNASQVFTEYASKATNTPFTGWELQGVIKKTICDGNVICEA